MNKVYIAGKITGLSNYKEKFAATEKELTEKGYLCMNPSILNEGFAWREYIHICLSMIDVCTTVYVLDNWQESEGAKTELQYAIKKGKKIIYQ